MRSAIFITSSTLLLLRWLFPVWEISVAGKLNVALGVHPIWETPSVGATPTLDWTLMGLHSIILIAIMVLTLSTYRNRQ